GGVDRPDPGSAALELLSDARRAREEVDRGRRSGAGDELAEDRDEPPPRAEVLDHRPIIRSAPRPLKHPARGRLSGPESIPDRGRRPRGVAPGLSRYWNGVPRCGRSSEKSPERPWKHARTL